MGFEIQLLIIIKCGYRIILWYWYWIVVLKKYQCLGFLQPQYWYVGWSSHTHIWYIALALLETSKTISVTQSEMYCLFFDLSSSIHMAAGGNGAYGKCASWDRRHSSIISHLFTKVIKSRWQTSVYKNRNSVSSPLSAVYWSTGFVHINLSSYGSLSLAAHCV